jgi:DNA-binding response OmpR family regulator
MQTTTKETHPPTILIVEDDAEMNDLLAAQLQLFDFNLVRMMNGLSALEWLKCHQPDLVLLDWMLPDVDGFQICQRIRERYSSHVLPIVMLSAYSQQAERRVIGLEAGANDFIAKPYELKELIARIQTQLLFKQQTQRLVTRLSEYTSHSLRRQLEIDPDKLSLREEHEVVVIFADLRGFTCLIDKVPPEISLKVLDDFFEEMMLVVQKDQGCVLDITGDEMLVVFNFSDVLADVGRRAMETAIHMQGYFNLLKQEWPLACREIGLGIGMHRGIVMVGEVGGPELKRFTVVGNVVNIAHRLVKQARSGEIVMSLDTYASAREIISHYPAVQETIYLQGTGALTPIRRLSVCSPDAEQ